MKYKDLPNGHICFNCSMRFNLVLQLPVKVIKNKCINCKRSIYGASKKYYIKR